LEIESYLPYIRQETQHLSVKLFYISKMEIFGLDGPHRWSTFLTLGGQKVLALAAEMGGMKGLDYEYGHNKPIEFNETSYYLFQYRKGDAVAASRVEAWEFIVGGGASFNHLNSRYTVEDPAGKAPDNAQILIALRNLKNFIYSFDFVTMFPDKNFVVSGIPRRNLLSRYQSAGRAVRVVPSLERDGRLQ
jgi:hypothetical protein